MIKELQPACTSHAQRSINVVVIVRPDLVVDVMVNIALNADPVIGHATSTAVDVFISTEESAIGLSKSLPHLRDGQLPSRNSNNRDDLFSHHMAILTGASI